jgi:hypothetical protein
MKNCLWAILATFYFSRFLLLNHGRDEQLFIRWIRR